MDFDPSVASVVALVELVQQRAFASAAISDVVFPESERDMRTLFHDIVALLEYLPAIEAELGQHESNFKINGILDASNCGSNCVSVTAATATNDVLEERDEATKANESFVTEQHVFESVKEAERVTLRQKLAFETLRDALEAKLSAFDCSVCTAPKAPKQ